MKTLTERRNEKFAAWKDDIEKAEEVVRRKWEVDNIYELGAMLADDHQKEMAVIAEQRAGILKAGLAAVHTLWEQLVDTDAAESYVKDYPGGMYEVKEAAGQ